MRLNKKRSKKTPLLVAPNENYWGPSGAPICGSTPLIISVVGQPALVMRRRRPTSLKIDAARRQTLYRGIMVATIVPSSHLL